MKNKLYKKYQLIILKTLASLVAVFFICLIMALVLNVVYAHKFYAGVKVAGINLGGLTPTQAQRIFAAKIEDFNTDGQKIFYKYKNIDLYPITLSATDPDLLSDLITFDLDQTLTRAYQLGRSQNFFSNFGKKIQLILLNKNIGINYTLRRQEIIKVLKNNFNNFEQAGQNPQIEFVGDEPQITREKLGLVFDYNNFLNLLEKNLATLNFAPIELKLTLTEPEFRRDQAVFLLDQIKNMVKLAPLTLTATSTNSYNQTTHLTWAISADEFKKMLGLVWQTTTRQPQITCKTAAAENFLNDKKGQVEKPVKEAKFNFENNRVTEFQASSPGIEINVAATLAEFEDKVINQKQNQINLLIKKIEPQNNTGNINALGIRELIGVGQSNFSGSPVNRRHNIAIGAQSLNGLLIAPGEEFSANAALGEINAAKGYLPELVIKGNETLPEYGGGLCQIATTLFRVAINSGLEVTQRKPHAYRVVYYEPAGTDATIYAPAPDLKFINNTPAHLLLQTKVEGDNLTFELWGTSDGRQVATTSPEIFNIVKPGPTKYIETTELAPEKVKCVEVAHNGADAFFKRTISWPNDPTKATKTETWESHYRPWQAVCRIGVDPNKVATSTSSVIGQ